MDLLKQYKQGSDSSDSDDEEARATLAELRKRTAQAAPHVDTTALALVDGEAVPEAATRFTPGLTQHKIFYNVPHEELHAPVVGPAHPFSLDGLSKGMKNHASGHVEDLHVNPVVFDMQYNAFHATRRAEAPAGDGTVVGEAGGEPPEAKRRKTEAEAWAERQAREKAKVAKAERLAAEAAAADPEAPWRLSNPQPWAEHEVRPAALTDEQLAHLAEVEKAKKEKEGQQAEADEPKAVFHGKAKADWQGRSWLAAPKGLHREVPQYYLPKRWIHTWSGHTKGVNAIRFFPKTGHLLLSAGLDNKVKIWDVLGGGKCMQTYMGHSKGVRDITFNNDGTRFLSTAYDKQVHLWDTETGQVIRTIKNNAMNYVVRLHPDDDKQNVLMTGASDKKVYQFDLDSGDLVQTYDYHLGAVNTITFLDSQRFVSTSDDKTIRLWDLGIPVQVKYIADPAMHSMPAVAKHPTGKFLCFQSLDNQIVTYTCKDKFKLNNKKTFKGHLVSGNACQVNFSPDGTYIMSGDGVGKLYFWEWSHPNRIVRTIPAHDKTVCIGCEWHPLESSKVATCGWDGLIKYWD